MGTYTEDEVTAHSVKNNFIEAFSLPHFEKIQKMLRNFVS
jgi:hypothetical protein